MECVECTEAHLHQPRVIAFRGPAWSCNICASMNPSFFVLSLGAALSFVVGGSLMKLSNGFVRFVPGSTALVLFLGGAVMQTFAMKQGEMGVSYVFILGLEAFLAFIIGVFLFHESVSLQKVVGVILIIVGFSLLHVGGPSAP